VAIQWVLYVLESILLLFDFYCVCRYIYRKTKAFKEQDMKALIQHITKVAVADTKLFFEPFVAVYKFIKSDFNRNAVKH
jgi:hypothetical protein